MDLQEHGGVRGEARFPPLELELELFILYKLWFWKSMGG